MTKKSTSLDVEKMKAGEANEVLDAIGQENEKEGIRWTKHFMDAWDKRTWEKNQLSQEKLKKKTKWGKPTYYQAVAGMLSEEAKEMDIPFGYQVGAYFSGEGVILKMVDRWGKKYHRAFKPDGTPSVDFIVIVNLLVELQNTIDYLEYKAKEELPQNGIILK